MSKTGESTAVEIQHVNVKLMLADAAHVDLEPLIPTFNRWIQEQAFEELLLDIGDYRHVPAGPGVVLIGHQANYSVDNADNRLGVRYNRKAVLAGSNQDRLVQATRAALIACRQLEAEPLLAGKLRFGGHEIEITINDRLLAPNDPATREALDPDLHLFLEKLFRGSEISVAYPADRRSLFGITAKASRPFSIADLLANIGS